MFKTKVKQRSSYNRWLDDVYNHKYIRKYVIDELEVALSKNDSKSVRNLFPRLNKIDELLNEFKAFVDTLEEIVKSIIDVSLVIDKDAKYKMDKKILKNISDGIYEKWIKFFFPFDNVYIRDIDNVKLGNLIREFRKKNYYSRKTVCDYLGISISCLTNYETGYRVPNLSVIYAFSQLYKMSIDDILKQCLK